MRKNHEKKAQPERNHLQPRQKRSRQSLPKLNKAVIGALRNPRPLSGDVYHDSLHQQRQSRNR